MTGAVKRIRVRHGKSTESKASAKKLVKALDAEFGEVIEVVARTNRDDPSTAQLQVGIEYFGDAVQLQDDAVWVGTPPSAAEQKDLRENAAPGETGASSDWTTPAVDELGSLLSELFVEDEHQLVQAQKLEDGDSFMLLVSVAVAVGAACFAAAPHLYHFS